MARARNIKPGLYKNEDLAECSIWARYIFPGLWMLADREGRLEDRPKRIKGELLPFDAQDVEPLLAELEARGFLVRYRNSDGSFIQISKFSTHQTPHYSEKASVIKPPELQESPRHDEPNIPGVLPEDSKKEGVLKGGSQPPDSLIPDSPIPDTGRKPLSSAKPTDLIPYQVIVDSYHAAMVNLPKVRELTDKRRTLIRTAWQASQNRRSPQFWKAYFEECADDAFLNGSGPYRPPHDNWRPTFDYLMRGDTVTKVYEKAMDRLEREAAA